MLSWKKEKKITEKQLEELQAEVSRLREHLQDVSQAAILIARGSNLTPEDAKLIEEVSSGIVSIATNTTATLGQGVLSISLAYTSAINSVLKVMDGAISEVVVTPFDDIVKQQAMQEYNKILATEGKAN